VIAQLPEPLVPPDVDLRGLEYMPLLGGRLLSSDFNASSTDAEWRAALTLWWAAWGQVPAGSLPNDDVVLCRLADLGRDVKAWRKVKAKALYGFTECSDGRLYHEVLCEQALIAWEKRVKEREKKAKWREKQARKEPGQDGSVHGDSEGTEPGRNGSGTADGTRRDGTGQEEIGTGTSPPQGGADLAGHQPTSAGAICRALRQAGIGDTNPGHPDLQVLLDAGATEAEFLGAVDESLDKGKPFAYVLGVVAGQRKRAAATAAQLHRGPLPTTAITDRKNRQLTTAGLMTGAVRAQPQPQQEVVDVDARVIAPRKLG